MAEILRQIICAAALPQVQADTVYIIQIVPIIDEGGFEAGTAFDANPGGVPVYRQQREGDSFAVSFPVDAGTCMNNTLLSIKLFDMRPRQGFQGVLAQRQRLMIGHIDFNIADLMNAAVCVCLLALESSMLERAKNRGNHNADAYTEQHPDSGIAQD